MKREIKFRAWTGVNMKSNEELRSIGGFALIEGLSGKDLFVLPFPKYEIMQYIGLKDRNGVEIYEADIIKCKFNSEEAVGFIEYYDDRFVCNWITKTNFNDSLRARIDYIKVIGNIYENKELLK